MATQGPVEFFQFLPHPGEISWDSRCGVEDVIDSFLDLCGGQQIEIATADTSDLFLQQVTLSFESEQPG